MSPLPVTSGRGLRLQISVLASEIALRVIRILGLMVAQIRQNSRDSVQFRRKHVEFGWFVFLEIIVAGNDDNASAIRQHWSQCNSFDFFGELVSSQSQFGCQQVEEQSFGNRLYARWNSG